MTKSFLFYGDCEVAYDGRASSVLERGNYLIIYKPDKSISVHGAAFVKPLNYQNSGSTIRFLSSGQDFDDLCMNLFAVRPRLIIVASNKGETLTIAVHRSIQFHEMDGWTDNKIKLVKSEKDLVNQIVDNIYDYFPDIDIVFVDTEVATPYGNIDILLIDRAGTRHVIEVKRRIMSVAGCGQVARYCSYFTGNGIITKQYVAAPAITKNAMEYVSDHGQIWIKATFK